jgi:hypothetical protein
MGVSVGVVGIVGALCNEWNRKCPQTGHKMCPLEVLENGSQPRTPRFGRKCESPSVLSSRQCVLHLQELFSVFLRSSFSLSLSLHHPLSLSLSLSLSPLSISLSLSLSLLPRQPVFSCFFTAQPSSKMADPSQGGPWLKRLEIDAKAFDDVMIG